MEMEEHEKIKGVYDLPKNALHSSLKSDNNTFRCLWHKKLDIMLSLCTDKMSTFID